MKEFYYEKLFDIKTKEEQHGFHSSFHYHRYEPTPYVALEALFDKFQLNKHDSVVDFGCGKGRLSFFIDHLFKAAVTGVEMDSGFYEQALENRERYSRKMNRKKNKLDFQCCLAQDYPINSTDNIFYFFNPFSVQVFMNVINKVMFSFEQSPRELTIILYYPSEEYIYYLENRSLFQLKEEIVVPYHYEHNQNERFVIYQL